MAPFRTGRTPSKTLRWKLRDWVLLSRRWKADSPHTWTTWRNPSKRKWSGAKIYSHWRETSPLRLLLDLPRWVWRVLDLFRTWLTHPMRKLTALRSEEHTSELQSRGH